MPESLSDLAGLPVGAERFLGAVLETIEQPIWVVDHDGVIRFANPAAITTLGYHRADELLGRPSHETIHYRHPDGTHYPVEECPMLLPRTTGGTVTSELDWFIRQDGTMFPVSYSSVPLEMPDGRGAVVAFTDIEDRLRAEQVLREHDAALAAQQASLRRVATLVAGGATSSDVFAAIAREVGQVIGLPLIAVWRYESDEAATVVGVWSDRPHPFQVATRWPLDGPTVTSQVLKTGRPVRIDDWTDVPGTIGSAARETGITAAAGAPIIVDGDIWGAMSVDSIEGEPLPDDIEDRLVEFTELISAAFATTARQEELARLADEQAALRRVAMLVARESSPFEVFGAVTEEAARFLGTEAVGMLRFEPDGSATLVAQSPTPWDPPPLGSRFMLDGENVVASVHRTGQAARMDEWEKATGAVAATAHVLGVRSTVATPIVVEGRLWGTIIAATSQREPLPADTESRLVGFTELVATAISNAEARGELSRLAEEQAALRRVATLVARGVPASELFGAVTGEVGRLLGVDLAEMIRYVSEDSVTAVATWAAKGEHPPVEGQWSLAGDRLVTTIARTGRPTREDRWDEIDGPIADFARTVLGIRSSVGSPIVVEGQVWGALLVNSKGPELADGTASRLTDFTELVATAISNAQARAELHHLAEEQAGLRRVATLVAEERSPTAVFTAVAAEVARIPGVEATMIYRYDAGQGITVVAGWGDPDFLMPVDTRLPLGGENIASGVFRTGRPARMDDYGTATGSIGARARALAVRSGVGCPIVVDGRLWGAMIAMSGQAAPLPTDTESRVGKFTELVATAISNVQARSDLAASRARIVAAADEERRRVVRDLHDGAQQRLVHTVITLKLARRALEKGDDAASLLAEALAQAERTNNELRELAHGILPAVLTRGGLRAGVEALASRTPVPVELGVSVGRLPPAVEATGYFVVAEALTNVAKHSGAGHAEVTARIEDGTLRVRVCDDGIGGARSDGSGLIGLTDRLAALGGRLRVESPSGEGTIVAADIPLPE